MQQSKTEASSRCFQQERRQEKQLNSAQSTPNKYCDNNRRQAEDLSSKNSRLSNRSKSRSPMQCAEMVFGNITNMEKFSSQKCSPDQKVKKIKNALQGLRKFEPQPIETRKMSGVNHLPQQVYSPLTTEQILRISANPDLQSVIKQNSHHSRSRTMPEIQLNHGKIQENSNKYNSITNNDNNEIFQETQTNEVFSHLRQENMILAAEKSNMQAELVFYKNELAKLCLLTGSKFPVFRQQATSTMTPATSKCLVNSSFLDASQILAKNSSNSYNISGFENNNPKSQMLYNATKQTSADDDDRYVCISQMHEEQASTTMGSCLRNGDSCKNNTALDFGTGQVQNSNENLTNYSNNNKIDESTMLQNQVVSPSSDFAACQLGDDQKTVSSAEVLSHLILQSPDNTVQVTQELSAAQEYSDNMQKNDDQLSDKRKNRYLQKRKNNKENTRVQANAIQSSNVNFNCRRQSQSIKSSTSNNIVHQVTVNLAPNKQTSVISNGMRRKRSERANSRLSNTMSQYSRDDNSPAKSTINKAVEHLDTTGPSKLPVEVVLECSKDDSVSLCSKNLKVYQQQIRHVDDHHSYVEQRESLVTLTTYQSEAIVKMPKQEQQADQLLHDESLEQSVCSNLNQKNHIDDTPTYSQHNNDEHSSDIEIEQLDLLSKQKVILKINTTQEEEEEAYGTNQSTIHQIQQERMEQQQNQLQLEHDEQEYEQNESEKEAAEQPHSIVDGQKSPTTISMRSEQYQITSEGARSQLERREKVQAQVEKCLSSCSPLKEQEMFLESSHRALQDKLNKVREELMQLSENEKNLMTIGSAEDYSNSICHGFNAGGGVAMSDNGSSETRAQFEDELARLRQQLHNFNDEEQKVIHQLEMTRTLRKANEGEINLPSRSSQGCTAGYSEVLVSPGRESFQLLPQMLNFDGCSQKSTILLNSPILCLPMDSGCVQIPPLQMTQESSKHPDFIGTTESEENSQRSAVADKTAGFASVSEVNDSINILAQSSAEAIYQSEQYQQISGHIPVNHLTTLSSCNSEIIKNVTPKAGMVAPSMLWISQIIEEEHESESAADSGGHSRCASSQLQTLVNKDIAKLIQDEQNKIVFNMNGLGMAQERQSCPVIQNKVENEEDAEVNQLNQEQKDNRAFRSTKQLYQSVIDASAISPQLVDHQSDIRLFSNDVLFLQQEDSSNGSSLNNTTNANEQHLKAKDRDQESPEPRNLEIYPAKQSQEEYETCGLNFRPGRMNGNLSFIKSGPTKDADLQVTEKFEKLIQQTQQSDEACLLRHIQMNLQQIQSSENYCSSHIVSQLKQQESPSPFPTSSGKKDFDKLAFTSKTSQHSMINQKYLQGSPTDDDQEADQECSVDTQQLIKEYQQNRKDVEQEEAGVNLNHIGSLGTTDLNRNTQMSETIQFLAAGQTGTTQPMASNRSSIDQNNYVLQTECVANKVDEKQILPQQQLKKSRNCFNNDRCQSSKAGQSADTCCQIRILQDPKAADTMSSGGAAVSSYQNNNQLQLSSSENNSLILLSQASPCFQQLRTFEMTKQWGACGVGGNEGLVDDNVVNREELSFMDGANPDEVATILNAGDSIFDGILQRKHNKKQQQTKTMQQNQRKMALLHLSLTSSESSQKDQEQDEEPINLIVNGNKKEITAQEQHHSFGYQKNGNLVSKQQQSSRNQKRSINDIKTDRQNMASNIQSQQVTFSAIQNAEDKDSRLISRQSSHKLVTKQSKAAGNVFQYSTTSINNLQQPQGVQTDDLQTKSTHLVSQDQKIISQDEPLLTPRMLNKQSGVSQTGAISNNEPPSTNRKQRPGSSSLYGSQKNSYTQMRTPKAQLMRPVRQQMQYQQEQQQAMIDSNDTASGALSGQAEKRSSYNLYKRNSVKMSKSGCDGVTNITAAAGTPKPDSDHLNNGLVLNQQPHASDLQTFTTTELINEQVSQKLRQRYKFRTIDTEEASDTQLHHAASQSTLNLGQRSPLNQKNDIPTALAKFNKKNNKNSINQQVDSQQQSFRSKQSKSQCFSSIRTKHHRSQGSSGSIADVVQQSSCSNTQKKYEANYDDYINGTVSPRIVSPKIQKSRQQQQNQGGMTRNHNISVEQQPQSQPNKQSSASSGSVGNKQHLLIKAKSLSSLGISTNSHTALVRPSPRLYKRTQESALSVSNNNFQVRKSPSGTSAAQTTSANTERHHLRKNSQIKTNSTTASKHSMMQYQNQQQRSVTSLTSSSSMRYLSKGAGLVVQATKAINGPQGAPSTNSDSAVVVLHSGESQANTVVKTTPNYMQPIQQKFRKQTIQMVKEKQGGQLLQAAQDKWNS